MQLDPALGHSTAQRLREELSRGSWQGTETVLESLRVLIATGMGRCLGSAVLAKRLGQAVQRDPDHRAAHARMLVASTEKWGGSHAAMFAFAREAAARATPGSSLQTLLPGRLLIADGEIQRGRGRHS